VTTRTVRTLLFLLVAGLLVLEGSVALGQVGVEVAASTYPDSVTSGGGLVTYQIQVGMPASDLPVMITSVSSDIHGDVSDPSNPVLHSTTCAMPVDWQPDSVFGWALGWGCEFAVWTEAEPGELSVKIAAVLSGRTAPRLSYRMWLWS
jgi:hypothetical protein